VAGKKLSVQEELAELAGLAEKCLQCGLCSSICPPTRFSEKGFNVRRLSMKILRAKAGRPASLGEIWSCFVCFDCLKLCPHSINLPEAVVRLRRSLAHHGEAGEAYKGVQLYLENMLRYGRMVSVAKTDVRKRLGLRVQPSLPEEALKRLRLLMEKLGFTEEAEMWRSLYGGGRSEEG